MDKTEYYEDESEEEEEASVVSSMQQKVQEIRILDKKTPHLHSHSNHSHHSNRNNHSNLSEKKPSNLPTKIQQRLLITETDPYYGDFINLAPGYTVSIDRTPYISVEHYYQSMKFRSEPRLSRRVAESVKPAELAAQNLDLVRDDWEGEYRVAVMRNALDHKVRQSFTLKQ